MSLKVLRFSKKVRSRFNSAIKSKNSSKRIGLLRELVDIRKSIKEHEDFIGAHPNHPDNGVRRHLIDNIYGPWAAETAEQLKGFRRKK